jgi:hypothetical protein
MLLLLALPNTAINGCKFRTLIFNSDKNLHDSLQSLTRNMAHSAKATSSAHVES